MKVISHHHARLATPIRSVQRVLDDIEPRSAPYRDMNRPTETQGRPYLLIEATAVANAYRDADQSANSKNGSVLARDEIVNADGNESNSGQTMSPKKEVYQAKDEILSNDGISKSGNHSEAVDSKAVSKHKSQLEGLDSMGLNSKDITLLGAAFEKPPANIAEDSVDPQTDGEASTKPTSDTESVRLEKNLSNMVELISQPSQKLHSRMLENTGPSSQEKTEKASKSVIDLDSGSSREEKKMD
mgnify:FL=1